MYTLSGSTVVCKSQGEARLFTFPNTVFDMDYLRYRQSIAKKVTTVDTSIQAIGIAIDESHCYSYPTLQTHLSIW